MLLRGKQIKKECGILLPLSSLPSDYGIGSFGKEAYEFIDFLRKTKQNYWQILPLCPIGKGNSPYTSYSCFAGEILYIDLELLVKDGLLSKKDIPNSVFPDDIDYEKVRKFKTPLLKKAAKNFNCKNTDFKKFADENHWWLENFSCFMALKDKFGGKPFKNWNEDFKYRLPCAIEEFKQTHSEEILFYKITQYFFFCQYNRLHNYANASDIKIIGDLPFYVSPDSADVWGNPDIFKLSRDMSPVLISGVPPDIFSETGQLWGNPIYNWEFLKSTDYLWWRKRLMHNANLYDVIRIDHFRAFAEFYAIPSGSPDARFGNWEKGPGINFWNSVKPHIKNTQIIAEDLGGEDSVMVQKLITDTEFPNMKVLQFAFDSDLSDIFLPRNFTSNCVCYTGTHDNNTTHGWYKNLSVKERIMFERLVPRRKFNSPVFALISYAMNSKAKLVIIPFQDYLQLDDSARINTPGSSYGNWQWRYKKGSINEELCKSILKLTKSR